jgi:hypothetical protein
MIKNQSAINLVEERIHKPPHFPGSNHDYNIFNAKHPLVLPNGLETFLVLVHRE